MLITINLSETPWARISPSSSGWSAEQTKELDPVVWSFQNDPRWTRKFSSGSRAWKWHPEGPKVTHSGSSLRAPSDMEQWARDSPRIRPVSSAPAGATRPLGNAQLGRHSNAAATQGALGEKRRDPSCSTRLRPPGVPEPIPSFPLAHPGKPSWVPNKVAMCGKRRG